MLLDLLFKHITNVSVGALTLLGFSVVKGGAKNRVVIISFSPQGGLIPEL